MVKGKGIFSLLLLFFLNLAPCGFAFISEVTINPNPIAMGNRFTITILLDIAESNTVSVREPDLPQGIELWRGPYIRPTAEASGSGIAVRKTTITYTYYARRVGKILIPGYTITAGGREAVTDPQVLSVGVMRNRVLTVPLEARWKVVHSDAFVGEPVPLVLEVYNQEEIILFSNVIVSSPQGGLLEEIEGGGEISQINYGPIIFYSLPAKAFLYTPSRVGRSFIEEATVESPVGTGKAPGISLNVEPAPEAIAETGAIGSFSFGSSISSNTLYPGEVLELRMTVTGLGNLNYLKFPSLELQGLNLLEKRETGDFKATLEGYQGFREILYRLVPSGEEDLVLTVPRFRWLNKDTGRIESSSPRVYRVKVVAGEKEGENFPFNPITEGNIKPVKESGFYGERKNYLFLLIGPVIFLIFFILKTLKFLPPIFLSLLLLGMGSPDKVDNLLLKEGAGYFIQGDFKQAEESFLSACDKPYHVPEILYNLSLCAFKENRSSDAVIHIQRAIRLAPMEKHYRSYLKWMQGRIGVSQTVPPVGTLHPDLFFFLLLVFVSLTSFLAILILAKKRGIYTILLILCLIFSLGSGFFLFVNGSAWNRQVGVVASPAAMVRIPKETATPWIELPEGLMVYIKGRTEDFLLVETGDSVRGWVDKDSLIIDFPFE